MLLVKPGAVKAGVTFRYTELRRAPHRKGNGKGQTPRQVAPTTVLTATNPIILAQTGLSTWLYLPLVNTGAANTDAVNTDGANTAEANTAEANTTEANIAVQADARLTDTTGVTGTVPSMNTVQPVSDHNVAAYAIWQLDAIQDGTRVPTFTQDWNITGSADTDCTLAKFAQYNRLLTVKVEVNAGGWQTLRSYQLSQAYNTTQSNTARRLMLMGIDQKGKNGTVLNHYSFTYNCTPGDCAALVNTLRLLAANNGWGGQINYTYTGYQPSASNTVCNNHCTRNAVTRTDIQDGLSHTRRVDYYYGPTVPTQSGDEWSAIANTHEFLGFKRSQATYYATDLSTVVKWDQVDTWQGQRDDPDPRRGRIQHQEVRTAAGGTLLAVTDNTWNAYRRLTGD